MIDRIDILTAALETALENMGFIQLDPIDNPEWYSEHPFHAASLSVLTPLSGTVAIAVANLLLDEICAGIFSVDAEEISEETKKDTMLEMLNTVTGMYTRDKFVESERYEIGLPFLVDAAKWQSLVESEDSLIVSMGTEGMYLSAVLMSNKD